MNGRLASVCGWWRGSRLLLVFCTCTLTFILTWGIGGQYLAWAGGKPVNIYLKATEAIKSKEISKERHCQGLHLPQREAKDQTFQPIKYSRTYLFSAFLVEWSVQIHNFRYQKESDTFYCQLWYRLGQDKVTVLDVKAEVKDIARFLYLPYVSSRIVCALPRRTAGLRPVNVSVTRKRCGHASNLLPVVNPNRRSFSSLLNCVPPIHNGFNEYKFLVESIELKRLLGVDRFVFYNYSMGTDVQKVLQFYESQGIVDIVNWTIPLGFRNSSHGIYYYGQLAAINDCLYRYRSTSKYILFQDMDEFIIPQSHNVLTIPKLVDNRLRKNPKASSFRFRNTFVRRPCFGRSNACKGPASGDEYPVVVHNVMRDEYVFPVEKKGKLVVDPRHVTVMGIHQVIRGQGTMDEVPPNRALMYHYRRLKPAKAPLGTVRDSTVVDRYGYALSTRLKWAFRAIGLHEQSDVTLQHDGDDEDERGTSDDITL